LERDRAKVKRRLVPMESVPQHPRTSSPARLTAEEREVVAVYNDADRCWHIYSDSKTMRGTLLRLAQKIGAEVRTVGDGVEFEAPASALRFQAKRRSRGNPQNLPRTRNSPKDTRPPEGKVVLLAGS
jgi:hypothetical protein